MLFILLGLKINRNRRQFVLNDPSKYRQGSGGSDSDVIPELATEAQRHRGVNFKKSQR